MSALLISLTGADRRLLTEQAPHDVAKYAGIGGAVLTTAVFAALSSTFALRMAAGAPLPLAMLFGLVWGLVILNLDRWLVAANARQPSWWRNVLVALPRVVMALVIGLIMSTPLVLQLFAPEIQAELVVMQQRSQAAFEQDLRSDPRFASLPADRARITELQDAVASSASPDAVPTHPEVQDITTRLDAVTAQHDAAERAVACEKDGTCGSGRTGAGPAYEEKIARRDRLAAERQALAASLNAVTARVRGEVQATVAETRAKDTARLAELQASVRVTEQERELEVARQRRTVQAADGLLARIEALERLSQRNRTLHHAHIALLLFLTTIECLPVLVKLFQSFGTPTRYELLLQEEDRDVLHRRRQGVQDAIEGREMAGALQLDVQEARGRADYSAETALAQQRSAAELRLALRELQQWEAGEISRRGDDQSGLTDAA